MEGVSHATPLPHMEAPILDVKPLRCLAPISTGPFGYPPFPGSNPPPYGSGPPFGTPPFAPLYTPVLPTGVPREAQAPSQQTPSEQAPSQETPSQQTTQTPNGVPVAAPQGSDSKNPAQARNRSPVQKMTGSTNAQDGTSKTPKRRGRPPRPRPVVEMTSAGIGDVNQSPLSSGFTVSPSGTEQSSHPSGFTLSLSETESSNEKSRKRKVFSKISFNEGTVLLSPMEDGDRESVERTLMTFDGLRRRLLQVSDSPGTSSGRGKCPGLKAGAILMASGHRTNTKKRIGVVPGVEVGDIFYLRFELCLVGLHAQSMAGIDTLPVKFDGKEEPLAISIVSSGVYEDDDMEDMDVLIYTGQGGITKPGKQANDQKLERGNLALDKSSSRGNEIRVIKGMKDMENPTGKVYMYDGLYRIQESWIEKGKAGFSVFKYKLLRVKGQPEGSAIWKRTRQWKNNPSCRGFVILPDLSSGVENLSVCLVNEVDKEKGPAHFSYFNGVKYSIPLSSMKPPLSCKCYSVCISGDTNCCCVQQNGTALPYSSNGHLVNRKPVIYECGPSCTCSLNCRNRVTQKGVKFQIEVFKTRDKGWGLRSWDPIRAGSFICEYAGQVIDDVKVDHEEEDNDYIFEATINTDQNFAEWNYKHDLLGEEKPVDLNETQTPLPIIINAKDVGNVSRFINHSCSPNVFWQPVLFDHNDERYPHIMFFALKHIPPMTELTFDYGQSASESGKNRRKKNCLCGSSKCRGFFP